MSKLHVMISKMICVAPQCITVHNRKVYMCVFIGAPVDSITSSMTAGSKGDIVLKDFTLIDHLAAFDRERIPERGTCSYWR